MDGLGRSKLSRCDRDRPGSGSKRTGQAETDVVVLAGVPVARGGAEVPRVVVPGTAADNAAKEAAQASASCYMSPHPEEARQPSS
jgi:hypothetical protein